MLKDNVSKNKEEDSKKYGGRANKKVFQTTLPQETLNKLDLLSTQKLCTKALIVQVAIEELYARDYRDTDVN